MTRDDQDSVELLKGLSDLYRRSGQGSRALVLLLIAIQVAPADGELLSRLALLFIDTGNPSRALNALDRLVALQGETAGSQLLRCRALWLCAQHDQARLCFKRYLVARQTTSE
ncbi:tetratricopeptide repeat protein [Pseudomonas fluorescens]|jgi:type III secretion protein Y|uniref:tetratricopeptide repeat protein n=1 Tax=Pseudomonas fluorescens TaxID=294 RepID=UPI0037F6D80E